MRSVGESDKEGEEGLQKFEARSMLRIGEQVVHADRYGENQEHDEGEPPHRVAVESSASGLRHQRVEGDIGRHQPEIHDRMQRHGEERARQAGIDRRRPSEAAGQQYECELDENSGGRPCPIAGLSR